MSEKMREEFNNWVWSGGADLDTSCYVDNGVIGDYIDVITQHAWIGWQASRTALVVELPKTPHFSASDEADLAYELAIDDMKDIIESLGVKCK